MPGLTIGDTVPDLELETTHGKIRIHDFVGSGYAIIFSHPGKHAPDNILSFWFCFKVRRSADVASSDWLVGDFTPVCTTELGMMAKYAPEFEKRGVKLLGLSCDDVDTHKDWIKDIEAFTVISHLFNNFSGIISNFDKMVSVHKHYTNQNYKVLVYI